MFEELLKRMSKGTGQPRGRFLAEVQASNHGRFSRLEAERVKDGGQGEDAPQESGQDLF